MKKIIKGLIKESKFSMDGNFLIVIADGNKPFPANNLAIEGFLNQEDSDSLTYELRKDGKLVEKYGEVENGNYGEEYEKVEVSMPLGKKLFAPAIPDFEAHDGAKFTFKAKETKAGVVMTVSREDN